MASEAPSYHGGPPVYRATFRPLYRATFRPRGPRNNLQPWRREETVKRRRDVEYRRSGDLLQADAEVLVNPVNCVGIMGRGLALQFKRVWPGNFTAYEAACQRGELRPGRMLVVETGQLANQKYIINFPTKQHWRDKSRMEDIDAGLTALVDEIRTRCVQSVAVPALGSGLGGLDWRDVRPRIEAALRALSVSCLR